MSAITIDSQTRRVSVGTANPSHRSYAPRVCVVIDPAYPAVAVQKIVCRMADMQHKHGIGAYLFINPAMNAYVLTDLQPVTQQWLRERLTWLCGYYSQVCKARVPKLVPTAALVLEDVIEHLADLRRLA